MSESYDLEQSQERRQRHQLYLNTRNQLQSRLGINGIPFNDVPDFLQSIHVSFNDDYNQLSDAFARYIHNGVIRVEVNSLGKNKKLCLLVSTFLFRPISNIFQQFLQKGKNEP